MINIVLCGYYMILISVKILNLKILLIKKILIKNKIRGFIFVISIRIELSSFMF